MAKGYNLGIDFGSTGTIISYMEKGEIITFKPNEDRDYITSAVFIDDENILIGKEALDEYISLDEDLGKFYMFFKMYLPLEIDKKKLKKEGWEHNELPSKITKIFFEQLLIKWENSFKNYKGDIESIVVSVPELWHKDIRNPGANALLDIFRNKLKLPIKRLVSEPVAATSYIVWKLKEEGKEIPRYLLTCDMGSGTFDISFCEIREDEIVVKEFGGKGGYGIGYGGYRFDVEVVKHAWYKSFGVKPDINSPAFKKAVYLFEEAKKSINIVKKFNRHIQRKRDLPILSIPMEDKDILRIYASSIKHSFDLIKIGVEEAIEKLKETLNEYSDYKVILVGGFSRFEFFKENIKKILDIPDKNYINIQEEDKYKAISKGCALIASGVVNIIEKFPHEIGLKAWNVREMKDEDVFIIRANTPREKVEEGVFSEHIFKIKNKRSNSVKIKLLLKLDDEEDIIELDKTIKIPKELKNKLINLGFKVDNSNLLYLLIKDKNDKENKNVFETSIFNIIGRRDIDIIVEKKSMEN